MTGNTEPKECERKFLIEYPDIAKLENNPNCNKIHITQTYLMAPEGIEKRVRQAEMDGNSDYYETTKKPINNTTRVEIENKISEKEYHKALSEADPDKNTIIKTRYCLTENNQNFEINIYPFWNDRAVMEIELNNESEKIIPPKDINIIKEVTNDKRYYNSSLASSTDIPLDKLKGKVQFNQQERVTTQTNIDHAKISKMLNQKGR